MNKRVILILILSLTFMLGLMITGYSQDFDYNTQVRDSRNLYKGESFTIEFSNMTVGGTYPVRIERLSRDGTLHSVLSSVNIVPLSDGTYAWSFDISAYYTIPEGGFPFRIVDDTTGRVLEYMYITDTPSVSFTSSGDRRGPYEAVGIGDIVYNDYGVGLLHNPEDTTGISVSSDGYILLHYRLPIASTSATYTIRLYNELTNESYDITSDDIYEYQADGTGAPQARRSYIVLSPNSVYPSIIDEDSANLAWSTGFNPMRANLAEGVYSYELLDETLARVATGESVLLVTNEPKLWELTSPRFRIREGSVKTWVIYRYSETISSVYNNHLFEDMLTSTYYSDRLATYSEVTEIMYRTEYLYTGEGLARWDIETTENFNNGLTAGSYYFYLTESYEVYEVAQLDDSLNNMLESFGLSGTLGELFFSVLIIILTSLGLAYINAGSTVIMIAVLGLVGVFSLLGFIPIWLIVGVLIFGGIGLLNSFGSGGGAD